MTNIFVLMSLGSLMLKEEHQLRVGARVIDTLKLSDVLHVLHIYNDMLL
jgi:hypothetical protein